MKRLYFVVFLCFVLWIACARSQTTSRPEIDFLAIDNRWSLSTFNEYMSGNKYSGHAYRYDTSGALWVVSYDSVYCGGMLGRLNAEQINSEIFVIFSSPIHLQSHFTLPDTSNCIDNGYLQSREKYEKLKKMYTGSFKRRSIKEDDTGEATTFDNGRARLELRYDKVRATKGEIVLIHLYP